MKIKMFVYKGVRIYKMSPEVYRLVFKNGVTMSYAPTMGGIKVVMDWIDLMGNMMKGMLKWQV